LPSTASVADTANVTGAPVAVVALAVMFAGTVMTGGVVSVFVTVTVKLFVAVLPCASCAEHVTVVVPIANVAPDAGVQLVVTVPSIASVALVV